MNYKEELISIYNSLAINISHPLSMLMFALALNDNPISAKLLLSTTLVLFSGIKLLTVKLILMLPSFPMIVLRGFNRTLRRMFPGPENGFPMEQL